MSQKTRSICWKCWKERNPGRDAVRTLKRRSLHCQGKGAYHEEETSNAA